MLRRSDIRIRDPFILRDGAAYYLYGTTTDAMTESRLSVFRSSDLETFTEPKTIFTPDTDAWALRELWAPEVHRYGGKFYLFVSILGKSGKRGVQIAVSDTPDGTFTPIADHPATPTENSCIDGTLYVEDGVPYIVYSLDWPFNYLEAEDIYSGEIWAMALTADLREPAGEPFRLFRSMDAPCSAGKPNVTQWQGKRAVRYGSDAPFLYRLKNGRLLILWSPYPVDTYVVCSAVSDSGSIRGTFRHRDTPVFGMNGGHPMLFTDTSGDLRMSIHLPERWNQERAVFLHVRETDDSLEVISDPRS